MKFPGKSHHCSIVAGDSDGIPTISLIRITTGSKKDNGIVEKNKIEGDDSDRFGRRGTNGVDSTGDDETGDATTTPEREGNLRDHTGVRR